MGAAMAPAAAQVIYQHLQDFKRNPEDYDKLSQGDDLVIENIYAGMDSGEMILQDKTSGEAFTLVCSFTDRQKAILKAGGLLKYVGLGGK